MRSPERKFEGGRSKFLDSEIHPEKVEEDRFFEDLLKQKNFLESSLKIEKEEKRSIQNSLEELKRKIRE